MKLKMVTIRVVDRHGNFIAPAPKMMFSEDEGETWEFVPEGEVMDMLTEEYKDRFETRF